MGSEFDQAIALGDAMYGRGEFVAAREAYERAQDRAGGDATLHFKIATCYWGEGNRYGAYRALLEAVRCAPGFARGHEWLGQWYLQEGAGEEALRHSLMAVRMSPHDGSILVSHAFVLEAAGDLDAAWTLISQLIEEGYTPPRAATLYGRLGRRFGKGRVALKLVEKLLPGATGQADRKGLHFAAAELYDSLGEYDRAFSHAREANRIGHVRWHARRCEEEFERQIAYFTPGRLRALARSRVAGSQPVFIVGMPRSGTSLVEQVVASHPQAHGAGELDFIHHVRQGTISMLGASEERYPQCLDRLTAEQADGLSEVYLEPLKAMSPAAKRITDKMPLNFMHLGLIALLLPGTRVIHCRRDPMDTCVSCYMTHFTSGHEFCADLGDLGTFYRLYARLMAHWREALPLQMLEVSYEALVGDPQREVAKILEFLDLPWDPQCLQFHDKRRFVTTASVEQVRRPMYSTSIGRWKHYRQWLEPLEKALG